MGLWVVSAISLTIVMVLCFAGAFCPEKYFNDNLLQRVGMFGIAVGCGPRLALIVERRGFDGSGFQPEFQMAVHVGLAAFAVGTAIKVWQHRPSNQRKPPKAPPPGRVHLYPWAGPGR